MVWSRRSLVVKPLDPECRANASPSSGGRRLDHQPSTEVGGIGFLGSKADCAAAGGAAPFFLAARLDGIDRRRHRLISESPRAGDQRRRRGAGSRQAGAMEGRSERYRPHAERTNRLGGKGRADAEAILQCKTGRAKRRLCCCRSAERGGQHQAEHPRNDLECLHCCAPRLSLPETTPAACWRQMSDPIGQPRIFMRRPTSRVQNSTDLQLFVNDCGRRIGDWQPPGSCSGQSPGRIKERCSSFSGLWCIPGTACASTSRGHAVHRGGKTASVAPANTPLGPVECPRREWPMTINSISHPVAPPLNYWRCVALQWTGHSGPASIRHGMFRRAESLRSSEK